ncbi:MAG TPA: HAD-IB family phosphatase [Candidatus Saccharimonadales bacterium]|nr:HAD-IB family phosphatase [Candidatus Saccharimonadales bacterium]
MAQGRKFAVFDIDGTLIRWQLYHAVVDNLIKNNVIEGDRFESIRGARMDWKRRAPGASFRSYELHVIQAYEQSLAKITPAQLISSFNEVFEEYKDQVYTYTRDLIAKLKKKEYLLLAISGSQSEIVELISGYYGFDGFVGTEYKFKDDIFTGQKIIHAHYKDKALKTLVKRFEVNWNDSLAVGDSKSDIAMLELVKRPIAFNPEKELFEHAREKGWKIVIERKNMVYELESRDGRYELVKTD